MTSAINIKRHWFALASFIVFFFAAVYRVFAAPDNYTIKTSIPNERLLDSPVFQLSILTVLVLCLTLYFVQMHIRDLTKALKKSPSSPTKSTKKTKKKTK